MLQISNTLLMLFKLSVIFKRIKNNKNIDNILLEALEQKNVMVPLKCNFYHSACSKGEAESHLEAVAVI